jgi:hypothetical protein
MKGESKHGVTKDHGTKRTGGGHRTVHGATASATAKAVEMNGLVSHTFFKPYAATFDFERMRLCIDR